MSQYIAIIDNVGPDKAIGVWFPDLLGCFSGGDTLEQAIANAPEAIALYAASLKEAGRPLPRPRRLSVLKSDPTFLSDLEGNMVALISVSEPVPSAAE
jgi:predicted RNase H-like HicB family nuclease